MRASVHVRRDTERRTIYYCKISQSIFICIY